MKTVLILLISLFVAGCAMAPKSLNDPARSALDTDVANLLRPRQILYETKTAGSVAVSYNIFPGSEPGFTGYRFTLIIRNIDPAPLTVEPRAAMMDGGGLQIQPQSYSDFMSTAYRMAGTRVREIPQQAPPQRTTGTITNALNPIQSYNYTADSISAASGSRAGNLAAALSQAMDEGVRASGQLMVRWAEMYWLRREYTLDPNAAAVGALLFPSPIDRSLPIKVVVTVGDQRFDFTTVGPN